MLKLGGFLGKQMGVRKEQKRHIYENFDPANRFAMQVIDYETLMLDLENQKKSSIM